MSPIIQEQEKVSWSEKMIEQCNIVRLKTNWNSKRFGLIVYRMDPQVLIDQCDLRFKRRYLII